MSSYFKMEALKAIYVAVMGDKNKERFEMILEPLQAIIQLALLSYCPIGSKLSISDNILCIQSPGYKGYRLVLDPVRIQGYTGE